MSNNIIYHIVTVSSWDEQSDSDLYRHSSLATEGFIHASRSTQLAGVLDRYYQGVDDLLLITVDIDLLASESVLKEEMAISVGEMFPHIYGPINKTAIIEVKKIR